LATLAGTVATVSRGSRRTECRPGGRQDAGGHKRDGGSTKQTLPHRITPFLTPPAFFAYIGGPDLVKVGKHLLRNLAKFNSVFTAGARSLVVPVLRAFHLPRVQRGEHNVRPCEQLGNLRCDIGEALGFDDRRLCRPGDPDDRGMLSGSTSSTFS
jgi:hypothetical protein